MTLLQLNKNRNLTFWSLHALGWSAYAISQYLGALLYGKAVAYNKVILIAALSGFVLSAWLRVPMPLAVEQAAGRDDRHQHIECVCDGTGVATTDQLGVPHLFRTRVDG